MTKREEPWKERARKNERARLAQALDLEEAFKLAPRPNSFLPIQSAVDAELDRLILERGANPEPKPKPPAKRRPGRPKGKGYAEADRALYPDMLKLIQEDHAKDATAAARQVAGKALGNGTRESTIDRLRRGFIRWQESRSG